MNIEALLGGLWSSLVTGVRLDVVRHDLYIDVLDLAGANIQARSIIARGVSEFRFFNSTPGGTWSYAELTDINVSATPAGLLRATITLWSPMAGMEFQASTITIDGRVIDVSTL